MARWRLMLAHYIKTDPPAEIEFKETDHDTGKQARKIYKIPRFLDPKDPSDHNYPGEIIVSNGKNAQHRDIIFLGDPTPDMEPVDDEARTITQGFLDSGRWARKEEGLDFGESLIKNFMEKIAAIELRQQAPVAVSTSGIDPKDFANLQEQVKQLVEQNAALQAQLLEKPKSLRRA